MDLPSDEATEAAADAAAEAEIVAGKGIPHALVREWLESWEKPDGPLLHWVDQRLLRSTFVPCG